MVPHLHKFLKFNSIQGDKNDCILFETTPRSAISFRHVSSCGTVENHLTIFKERHRLNEERVDGIFSPQPRRKTDAVSVLGTRFYN